jgi:hypothetical protein
LISFIPHPEIAMNDASYDPLVHKAQYRFDYEKILSDIANGVIDKRAAYRSLILNDLFFIVLFVMEIEKANHPFVVARCADVQDGPVTDTLDIWARYHYKSVIVTQAETIQYALKHPDHCTGIHCYVRPLAKKFLDAIKQTFEKSELLKWCFPDIVWQNPQADAPSWSLDGGITLKRKSSSRKEATVEAWGLVEGQATGRHFERNVLDDIETDDIRESPEQLLKCYSKIEMAENLGTGSDSDVWRIIGTFYSHFGPMVKLRDRQYPDGRIMYHIRLVPGSEDGTKEGKPVLVEPNTWEKLKTSQFFNSQQLCDPTPAGDIKIDFNMLHPIDRRFLPQNRLKFIIVDPAGDNEITKGKNNDSWAIGCLSVEPCMDDLGLSRIFIEEICYGKMSLDVAIDTAVSISLRNGRITGYGIEQVGTDTAYDHIIKGLRAQRRTAEIKKSFHDNGNVVLLSTGGKKKRRRIESSLTWPWNNGKISYVSTLPVNVLDALKEECNKFPMYHVDIIDMISYIYQLLEKMRFNFQLQFEDELEDNWQHETHTGISQVTGY